jgi:hypothetical protein
VVLTPAEDPVASDSVDGRIRGIRKRPVESDKLGPGANVLHSITDSIAVTSQVVVPIGDDDIVSPEELRYLLVEDIGSFLRMDIVALRVREVKEMCQGNCNGRFACSMG